MIKIYFFYYWAADEKGVQKPVLVRIRTQQQGGADTRASAVAAAVELAASRGHHDAQMHELLVFDIPDVCVVVRGGRVAQVFTRDLSSAVVRVVDLDPADDEDRAAAILQSKLAEAGYLLHAFHEEPIDALQ